MAKGRRTISVDMNKWESWLEKARENDISLSQVIEILVDKWLAGQLQISINTIYTVDEENPEIS